MQRIVRGSSSSPQRHAGGLLSSREIQHFATRLHLHDRFCVVQRIQPKTVMVIEGSPARDVPLITMTATVVGKPNEGTEVEYEGEGYEGVFDFPSVADGIHIEISELHFVAPVATPMPTFGQLRKRGREPACFTTSPSVVSTVSTPQTPPTPVAKKPVEKKN